MAIWLRHAGLAQGDANDGLFGARVGAPSDIISADEFGTLVALDQSYAVLADERGAILATARTEGDRLIADGEARAQQLLVDARREYDTAAEAGYQAGSAQALADWMERLALAGDSQAQLQKRMRERLADVVAVAVEQIVKVEQRDMLFERALSAVDRIVDGATYLHVAVHPDDHDHAKLTFDRLAARWRDLGQAFPLSVIADKRLEPGSCVCESDFGTVDASLDTQIRAMRSAVSRALKRSVLEADGAARAATMEDDAGTEAGLPAQVASWSSVE